MWQISVPADMSSLVGECAVLNQTMHIRDAYTHPSFNATIDKKTGYKTRSMLIMPIVKGSIAELGGISTGMEKPIGVVQCINKLGVSGDDSKDERGLPIFSGNDEKTLAVFSRQVAPILEKLSLKKRKPRKKNELTRDWVQNVATLAILDVFTVVKVVIDRMRELVDADRASLWVLDRKRKELWTKVSDDLPEIRLKANSGIVGAVATDGRALNIEDAYKDPRFNRRIDASTGYRTKSILCLPIKNQRGEVIAVAQCINKRSGLMFTHEDLSNLDEFSWQVAMTLEFKASMRDLSPPPNAPGEAADGADGGGGGGGGGGIHLLDGGQQPAVPTGDGVALLLYLVQSAQPEIQLHAAASIGYLSRNEANRERVVALGGVPVLLDLAYPYVWRSKELRRGIALSMANLSLSPAVRYEAASRGDWKNLLALARAKSEPASWFDSLRFLANLALHDDLQWEMLAGGALDVVLTFAAKPDVDLKTQAVRLAGNLSAHVAVEPSHARLFARPVVISTLGEATLASTREALPDFAAAYAKLAMVPAIAFWLFDVEGVELLKRFMAENGSAADDIRVHLVTILSACLRQRGNQRIVLRMLKSQDPLEANFRDAPTAKQRLMLLRERDALRTGGDLRDLMTRLLNCGSRNPALYTAYARTLASMAREASNHKHMLENEYVAQLQLLAVGAVALAGSSQRVLIADAQAAALQGLRYLADPASSDAWQPGLSEEFVLDDVESLLAIRFKLIPILMEAARAPHEATRAEVCRLVAALAKKPSIAMRMVKASAAPHHHGGTPLAVRNGGGGEGGEPPLEGPKPLPFLAVIGELLATPSKLLAIEASLAIEPFAADHKLALCQARVVGSLIALSQSPDPEVKMTASHVLKKLA